jgi:hypothetical protein
VDRLMTTTPARIVIFGQYKTGTTALFTLIRDALPGDTRTLFEPLAYRWEEGDSERWVLAKTILKYPGHPEPVDYASFLEFERRIYLVRDPRDWLVSSTLFLTQQKESIYGDEKATAFVLDYLTRKESDPESMPLRVLLEYILNAPPATGLDHFAKRTQGLQTWCIQFEARLENRFSLRYEDLVDGRLDRLSGYLGLPLKGDPRVDRAYDHVPRTRAYGDWKNWLLEEDADFFRPYFNAYIEYYGYTPDWTPDVKRIIRPEFASDYVARVMERKRRLSEP